MAKALGWAKKHRKKKQKYELETGEKFLRFTMCDCDQGFEEEE